MTTTDFTDTIDDGQVGIRGTLNNLPELVQELPRRPWPCGCIDLETLSTSADAVVLEIGCVLFDPATLELGPEYHAEVEMRAPDNRLRAIDAETWLWWGERMKEGADMPGMYGGVSVWQALQGLGEFMKGQELTKDFEMWAWGSDFDFAILRHAHDEAQLGLPWRYSRQCDARSFCEKLGIKREGSVMHQALADARQEARAVMGAMFKLEAMRTSNIERGTSNIEGREGGDVGTSNVERGTSNIEGREWGDVGTSNIERGTSKEEKTETAPLSLP